MKKLMIAAAISLVIAAPTYADDAHHPGQAQGMASTANMQPMTQDQTLQRMQANVEKMQSQLKMIREAKSPDVRNRLMVDHMMTIRDNMMMGMGIGCPIMWSNMGMMGRGIGMGRIGQGGNMYERMQQIEMRLDTMQKMMNQR